MTGAPIDTSTFGGIVNGILPIFEGRIVLAENCRRVVACHDAVRVTEGVTLWSLESVVRNALTWEGDESEAMCVDWYTVMHSKFKYLRVVLELHLNYFCLVISSRGEHVSRSQELTTSETAAN